MPHELLQAVEDHLASPDTTLGNGNDWGLVQKWLIVAAEKDGATPSKSWLAFTSNALLSNEDLIYHWIADRMDSTLGRLRHAWD